MEKLEKNFVPHIINGTRPVRHWGDKYASLNNDYFASLFIFFIRGLDIGIFENLFTQLPV